MSRTFADYVLDVAGSVEESSEFPQVHVSDEGDCVEIFFLKDNYKAERFDGLVTVYLSQTEGTKIVGALLKNVKSFICEMATDLPGFKAECERGDLQLKYLLTAITWKNCETDKDHTKILLDLRELVDSNEVTRSQTIPSKFACA